MANHKEHPNIEKEDWRLQAITTLTKEWKSPWTNVTHPTGTPVMSISLVRFLNSNLVLPLPNATALFLNFAYKLWQETQSFLINKDNFDQDKNRNFYPKNKSAFFDILEKRVAAIVFAYSALESFANEKIPDDYIFEKEREDRRCTERFNKEQIERHVKLEVKLGEILPNLLAVSSPKGNFVWNKFKALQGLRDRIVHLKSHDRKSTGPEEETIWKDILNVSMDNPALIAKEIIGYYLQEKDNKPRWFVKLPF